MISRKDVQHVARLARIELTPDEEEKFEQELSAIFDFIAKLDTADTAAVEPLAGGSTRLTTSGTALVNVVRDDEVAQQEAGSMDHDLLEAAPRKRDGYVEVKAVFDRD